MRVELIPDSAAAVFNNQSANIRNCYKMSEFVSMAKAYFMEKAAV